MPLNKMSNQCFHCGDDCSRTTVYFDDKIFCCNGCKTVYEIFTTGGLSYYYELENASGAIPNNKTDAYQFLDNEDIIQKLVDFDDDHTQVVSLYIPHIHCSSCIWVLENLRHIQPHIHYSQVHFEKKTARISYDTSEYSLKELVIFLNSIGYEPRINLEDYSAKKEKTNKSLLYKLGVSGFAFGNVMFLSFPEYFEVNEFWLNQYKSLFHWLMFAFSIPVVFYAGQDYFKSAYKVIRSKMLNIDIPIALGIIMLFVRSTIEIALDIGTGFFDSITGLIFFLLLGKFFQQKTYSFLSFERDYKSYFPMAVTVLDNGKEIPTQVYQVKKGDLLIIRHQEIIPVDSILMSPKATIDYSFVTGESETVEKKQGEKLFAGGKQISRLIEVETLKTVKQSYLTQLWSNAIFNKKNQTSFTSMTDAISKYFTISILSIALISAIVWVFITPIKSLEVFTAILIVACPCAIVLSAPFTFGNLLRIFGNKHFYVKNTNIIEQLAHINHIVFDKTGTITSNHQNTINYQGDELSTLEKKILKNVLRGSNHPLSRMLYDHLKPYETITIHDYKEHLGKGITAAYQNNHIQIGSQDFVKIPQGIQTKGTAIHININGTYRGGYFFKSHYREGLENLLGKLSKTHHISILSGDNDDELTFLQHIVPPQTELLFYQKPDDKLAYIKNLQLQHKKVLMIGDGLNDAGALKQSDVGIAISENINVFSPACDAILDAQYFNLFRAFITLSRSSLNIVKYSFTLSFLYNIVGLYFAITGQLVPIIAAILMPLSSISVIIFTTLATRIICLRKLKAKGNVA